MGYFDVKENVQKYIEMAKGFDGRELVEALKKHLSHAASVLELGMGPGKDYELLSQFFQVTGSDNSQVFLDRYKKKNPAANLLWLDAVTLDTEQRFDCIYSNKVLQHLTREQLAQSLHRQSQVLNNNGILLHSLWYGDTEEEFHGLRFVYYTRASFEKIVGSEYAIIEAQRYAEMEKDDSIYFVLKKH